MRRAFISAALLMSAPGAALGSALAVETEACPALDKARLERAVALEVRSLAGEGAARLDDAALTIQARCDKKEVFIRVIDAVTGKSIERAIPAPREQPERAVAFAASQLLLVSWLELTLDDAPPAAATADASARGVARRAATRRALSADSRLFARLGWEQNAPLAGGGVLGSGPRAAGGWASPTVSVALIGALRTGDASLADGEVAIENWDLGAQFGARLARWKALELEAAASAALGLMSLRGAPRAGRAEEARAMRGAQAWASAELHPGARWGRLRVSIPLGAGWIALAPRGRFASGEVFHPVGPYARVGIALELVTSTPRGDF